MQITGAKHKAIKALLASDTPRKVKGLDPKAAEKIHRQLSALQAAANIREVADSFPGWRVHELTPYRPGIWSLWVTGNYRLTFRLDAKAGTISEVDFEDYH